MAYTLNDLRQVPTIGDAIHAINPNASFSYSDNDIDNIVWSTGTTPIAKSDIQTKRTELTTAWNAKNYSRTRRIILFAQIGEQLDKLWHDIDDGKLDKTGSFYTYIKGIKDANAKP